MSSFTPLINQSNELLERKHYHIETIDYLLVSPADQKLFHISNKQILKNYSVSTSRFGLGNLMDSLKTPVGLHCIEEKIGSGMPMNTIFKGRKPIRNNMTLEDLYNDKKLSRNHFENHEDVITSRILRLKGLEPNINLGGKVDSYNRYIYIHGTAHENRIGQKASHGCVRMNNHDILELFDKCHEKMVVLILDN